MNIQSMNVATWCKQRKGYFIIQRYGDHRIELTREGRDTPKEAFKLMNRTYYQ